MIQTKKQRTVDDKISIFGILSATKALTNPINEIKEAQQQQTRILQSIEEHLAETADFQRALVAQLTRVAISLEARNSITN